MGDTKNILTGELCRNGLCLDGLGSSHSSCLDCFEQDGIQTHGGKAVCFNSFQFNLLSLAGAERPRATQRITGRNLRAIILG